MTTPLPPGLREKRAALRSRIEGYGSALVALSGGVDSATLAVFAHRVLGEKSLAVTGVSPALSAHARALVRRVLERHPLPHEWIRTEEMRLAGYRANGPDRCFFCKSELYGTLREAAARRGLAVVLDGANADDDRGDRPGMRAALDFGVRSPLREAGLGKSEVRALARSLGTPVAEEPASACLSSRIPHRIEVSAENLAQVEAGEAALRALGFDRSRVRHHGDLARLEVPSAEISRLLQPALRGPITASLRRAGFRRVAVDLRGYGPAGTREPPDPAVHLTFLAGSAPISGGEAPAAADSRPRDLETPTRSA